MAKGSESSGNLLCSFCTLRTPITVEVHVNVLHLRSRAGKKLASRLSWKEHSRCRYYAGAFALHDFVLAGQVPGAGTVILHCNGHRQINLLRLLSTVLFILQHGSYRP